MSDPAYHEFVEMIVKNDVERDRSEVEAAAESILRSECFGIDLPFEEEWPDLT